jgi:hypothetical protein
VPQGATGTVAEVASSASVAGLPRPATASSNASGFSAPNNSFMPGELADIPEYETKKTKF